MIPQDILVQLQNQARLECEADTSNDYETILESLIEDYENKSYIDKESLIKTLIEFHSTQTLLRNIPNHDKVFKAISIAYQILSCLTDEEFDDYTKYVEL